MKARLLLAFLLVTLGGKIYGQSTLATGDILFTGYNAIPGTGTPDTFKFILLTPISSSTTIYFTERGYQGAAWQGSGGTEGTISWTSSSALPIGTEVMIAGLGSAATVGGLVNGTVSQVAGGNAVSGLSLSNAGDQIIAFQGGGGDPTSGGVTFIAGINWSLNCGVTTDAGWATTGSGCSYGPQTSAMPPGLTGGTSAFLAGTAGASPNNDHARFNCPGSPFSSASAIRTAVMSKSNWSFGGATLTTIYTLTNPCTYYSSCTNPSITANPSNRTVCINGNTTFSITASGATGYQWQVNTGSGFNDILNGGVYTNATTATLSITGATAGMHGYLYRCLATNGACSSTSTSASLTVSNPSLTSLSQINVACNGGNTGAASVNAATGGIPVYTYNWSPGNPTGDGTTSVTGLTAGTWTCVVTDANSCTASVNFTVTQPPALSLTAAAQTNIACNGGNTGAASVNTATGGSPGYTYNWSPGNPTGDGSTSVTGLTAGTWTCVVTDANSCTASVNFTVTQPPALSLTASAQTNIACNGGNTGAASVNTATGGSPGYTYNWSPGNPTGDGSTSVTGLTAGTWTCVVTDANSCTASVNFTVTQPPALSLTANSQTNIACNGGNTGAASVNTATGGSPGYTYNWSPGNPTGDGTTSVTGLTAGTWTCVVTDANSCTASVNFTVTQPPALSLTAAAQTNIACNGGSTGAASVNTATGGSPGYTYNWSPGNPTGDGSTSVTGLTAGTWTCVVTDANSCTASVNFTVTQPPALSLTAAAQTNIACSGGSTGAASVNTATGGSPGYAYNWSPGSPTGDGTTSVTGLTAGSWTCVVTDANSCTASVNFTVTQPPALSLTANSQTNIACNGGTNGAASVNVGGGSPGYTYNWSPGNPTGDGTASVTGLSAGNYTVVVTDANSCTGTLTFNITEPTALTATTSKMDISCFGAADGSATVSPSGGTGTYIYSWSPSGGVGATASGLNAASYTVIITDANNCTTSQTATIVEPSALTANVGSITNNACGNYTNGAIDVSVAGGTTAYSYSWSNGTTTEDLSSLATGTYTLTVTDAHSCTVSVSATVTAPAALVSSFSTTNVACNGGTTGTIDLTMSGGVAPYAYNWNNGQITEDLSGLAAGVYTVTITDDNGCSSSASATVSEPAVLLATAVAGDISCNGAGNGMVDLSVTGGTAAYSFLWSNGNITEDLSGLTASNYMVTVTDANNCTASASATVAEPAVLTATVQASNVSCNGGSNGSADVTVTGGTTVYTYAWSNGGITEDLNGVSAGSYTLTITDAHGCTASVSASISEPALLSGSLQTTNVACNGGNNGAIDITVTGGTAGYTYQWAGGETTEDLNGLTAGTYLLTVTDANSCTATASVTITEPAILTASAIATNVSCNGGNSGAVNLTVSGGTTAYSFIWSNGSVDEDQNSLTAGTYSVTITDANACTVSASAIITEPDLLTASALATNVSCNGGTNGAIDLTVTGGTTSYTFVWSSTQTTEDLTGLAAGMYAVTVTDANGCTATASTSVTEPAILGGSVQTTDVSCNGGNNGAVDITLNGGTPAYTYQWSNSETTEDINGLTAGSYSVTVTDANGCSASVSVTITQPAILLASATATNVDCYGANTGAVDLMVTGGTTLYTYSWNNSAATEDLLNVTAGSYLVTVTDANSCTATATVVVSEPSALTASASASNVSCYGESNGTVDVTVNGGTVGYTYSWSNGSISEDISGLMAGTYVITITDANSCSLTASATVNEPAALNITTQPTFVTCNGNNNGAINLTVNGGTAAFTYNWNSGETSEDLNGLAAGAYSVTVTDANNCTATATETITEPAVLTVTTQSTDVNCYGGSTGAVDITVTGGTAAYTYSWSNSAGSEDVGGLTAGLYAVTVTDANSCSASALATVTEPTALTAGASVSANVSCNGGNNGAIDLSVTGGTPSYTYTWSNGSSTEDLSGLNAGAYAVTVTDAHGCSVVVTAQITEPSAFSMAITGADVTCNGADNGSVDITVSGGVGSYTYAWSNGAITEDLNNLSSGTYTVSVTDANNCTTSSSITIAEPAVLTATALATNVSCNAGSNGAIDVTVSGGTTAYTYNWSNTVTTEDVSGLSAGIYTVTITDAQSCTATVSATVTEPALLTASVQTTDVTCNSGANGAIDLTVTGGTAAYGYNWSNATTTQDLANLTAGNYSVTVTDANSCTATVSTTVTEPAALTATTGVTAVTCNGAANGAVDLTVNGGTGAYTYNWSNGASTEDLTAVTAGIYTVTVTDANNCSTTVSETVTEPAALTAQAQSTNLPCNGDNTGAIDLTVNGGTAAYTFAWSNGASTEDIASLVAGNYSVTISDANSCSVSFSATITEPTALVLTLQTTPASCSAGANGAIDLTASGGTGAFIYNWSNGSTQQDLTALAVNTYTVTVLDANNCSASASTTVAFVFNSPTVNLGADVTQCGGSVSLDAGSGGFTYVWNTGSNAQTVAVTVSGTYSVVVTDANSCTGTDTVEVTIHLLPQVSITAFADTLCSNASAITLSGTPTGGAFSGTGINGSSFNPQTAGNGWHTIQYSYTDGNNCSAIATDSVFVDVCNGLPVVQGDLLFEYYPNPNTGSFIVKTTEADEVGITLTNTAGQLVMQTLLSQSNGHTAFIDELPAGTYMLTCTAGKRSTTKKVIVIK